MNNEKIENLLNLALDATEREREKSLELDVGYNRQERTWEVIVKYTGTAERLKELLAENFAEDYERIRITNLQNEYAILLLPEAIAAGRRASCITPLQTGVVSGRENIPVGGAERRTDDLTGEGCIVAVIDSGERVIIMSS